MHNSFDSVKHVVLKSRAQFEKDWDEKLAEMDCQNRAQIHDLLQHEERRFFSRRLRTPFEVSVAQNTIRENESGKIRIFDSVGGKSGHFCHTRCRAGVEGFGLHGSASILLSRTP